MTNDEIINVLPSKKYALFLWEAAKQRSSLINDRACGGGDLSKKMPICLPPRNKDFSFKIMSKSL